MSGQREDGLQILCCQLGEVDGAGQLVTDNPFVEGLVNRPDRTHEVCGDSQRGVGRRSETRCTGKGGVHVLWEDTCLAEELSSFGNFFRGEVGIQGNFTDRTGNPQHLPVSSLGDCLDREERLVERDNLGLQLADKAEELV